MEEILKRLYQGIPLKQGESESLFSKIATGRCDERQLAAALIAMKMRGERPEEIAGAAEAFLRVVKPFPRPDYPFADIVGTGGDGTNTVNISTASALVAASCGVKVAKHGNRSVSSLTGSSDLLAQLGVDLQATPEEARQQMDQENIAFLFAPQYHPGFKYAMPVRQALKTRTLFNMLGPLVNPARPPYALIGVYQSELIKPVVETAKLLGFERVAVVHGGGMDEVALHAPTEVGELKGGVIRYYEVTPKDFGLNEHPLSLLRGGTAEENRASLLRMLQGEAPEAHEHAVAINVAMLLQLFGDEDLKENAERALTAIREGCALELLYRISKEGERHEYGA